MRRGWCALAAAAACAADAPLMLLLLLLPVVLPGLVLLLVSAATAAPVAAAGGACSNCRMLALHATTPPRSSSANTGHAAGAVRMGAAMDVCVEAFGGTEKCEVVEGIQMLLRCREENDEHCRELTPHMMARSLAVAVPHKCVRRARP
jgi:hypothetical protein